MVFRLTLAVTPVFDLLISIHHDRSVFAACHLIFKIPFIPAYSPVSHLVAEKYFLPSPPRDPPPGGDKESPGMEKEENFKIAYRKSF